jgi:hypothetical protein
VKRRRVTRIGSRGWSGHEKQRAAYLSRTKAPRRLAVADHGDLRRHQRRERWPAHEKRAELGEGGLVTDDHDRLAGAEERRRQDLRRDSPGEPGQDIDDPDVIDPVGEELRRLDRRRKIAREDAIEARLLAEPEAIAHLANEAASFERESTMIVGDERSTKEIDDHSAHSTKRGWQRRAYSQARGVNRDRSARSASPR